MDPWEVLPQELLEALWARLGQADLLACRRVSPAWRESLEESGVWRRFLEEPGCGASRSWERYLRLGKRAAAWSRANFRSHAVNSDNKLSEDKICIGNRYVYTMEDRRISFRKKTLSEVLYEYHVDEGQRFVRMRSSGDSLAILTTSGSCEYRLEVLEDTEVVKILTPTSRVFRFGCGGEVMYLSGRGLRLWSEGRGTREIPLPGEVTEVTELGDSDGYLAFLATHPVRLGAGFSVYLGRKDEAPGWKVAFTSLNSSPLATLSGTLFSSARAFLVGKHCFGESFNSSSQVLLVDGAEKQCLTEQWNWWASGHLVRRADDRLEVRSLYDEHRFQLDEAVCEPVAVHSRAPHDLLLACRAAGGQSSLLHYLRNGRKLYTLHLPFELNGAKFSKDCALLWSDKLLLSLTLRDPGDQSGFAHGMKITFSENAKQSSTEQDTYILNS